MDAYAIATRCDVCHKYVQDGHRCGPDAKHRHAQEPCMLPEPIDVDDLRRAFAEAEGCEREARTLAALMRRDKLRVAVIRRSAHERSAE